uniref:Coiled-coil domain-containing protein 187 n=1 Tax=Sciurus vulgaris TaxID=55149 RepID=A0A8D2E2I3_SCIVU
MPAPVLGKLPTYLGGALQSLSRDGQQQGLWSLRTLGRTDGRKTKPRDDRLGLPTAEDDLVAAPKWPGPWQQLGCRGTIPHTVWSDDMEDPGPRMGACSLPLWAAGQEARDGESSVSSGPLSGSSGGHESCAPLHGPWRERPPQMLGPQRQPRKSNPRLEQLKDKIRAQTQWQASCASLGTSAPSSASRLYRAAPPAPRRKTRRATSALPAPTRCPGQPGMHVLWLLGVHGSLSSSSPLAEVPREKTKRTRSSSWKREKPTQSPSPSRSAKCKDSKRAAATQGSPVHTWLPGPASACSDHQLSENTPSLTSQDQPATVRTAMAILQDLRQQIQAGLELACSPRSRRKLRPAKAKLQNPAGRRQQGPQSSRGVQGSFSNSPWAMTEGKSSSLDRASSSCTQQPRRTLAEWESCPQRAWVAHGWDPSLQRARDAPEKLAAFSRRPWSALGGQTCPQRAQAACEDWEIPVSRPWSSLERPRPAPPRSWSSSFVQKTGPPSKGRVAGPHPLGTKQAWSRLTQGLPQNPSRKEQDLRSSASCPRPRAPLGQQHSSESLRDFMRQKAQARRQQALERKALATRTLELRNQRLQEVYRKQREAVLGKAVPVVSQTNPGIVTFVPSSGLEAPESLASPMLQWSKVTSGKVLGGQEAPGSFCLCLNRAWDRTETLETGTGYKQARLQALETMANVLKQRIDILTTKLRGAEASDTALDWPPVGPSTEPAALTLPVPTCPGALVPNRETGAPQDWVGMQAEPLAPPACFLDDGPQLWSPSWEPQGPSPRARHHSQPQGRTGALDPKAALPDGQSCPQALHSHENGLAWHEGSELMGGPHLPWARWQCPLSRRLWAPDPTCSSLGLEDMPAARGAGLVMPWSTWSCGKGKPADGPWDGWPGGQGWPPETPSTACGVGRPLP